MTDNGYNTPKHARTPHGEFKTPYAYATPQTDEPDYFTPATDTAESDCQSDDGSMSSASSGTNNLTLIAEFDELMRLVRQNRSKHIEEAFLNFVEEVDQLQTAWKLSVKECQRLHSVLEKEVSERTDLERELRNARRYLDNAKQYARKVEEERDQLEVNMANARALLLKDNWKHLADETKEQLGLTKATGRGYEARAPELSVIQEGNTTGSLISDLSYSKSEDDLDMSILNRHSEWKKHRSSTEQPLEPAAKKRKSDNKVVEISGTDMVRATTTVTVSQNGPIRATSVIESVPTVVPKTPLKEVHKERPTPSAPPAETIFNFWQKRPTTELGRKLRQHSFQNKSLYITDMCRTCDKRIHFGRTSAKCTVCGAVTHQDCKMKLPLPCIPVVHTPTQKGALGLIGDYTPTIPPMVPALIIHCVNEIELRGLGELGLYRVPGSEKDVKSLKENFLKRKGAPCLNQVDIHVLCGTVKDFLRSLREPLVTHTLWRDFVNAVEAPEAQDIAPTLYQLISELPQPNRDTLAYMMLHLQQVADSKECKMPKENLAKVFGPTIVGYSCDDLDEPSLFKETAQQARVMEQLLQLPSEYWAAFVNQLQQPSGRLQQTPSTDSLLRQPATKEFFTPRMRLKRKERLFATPPSQKR